jgi:hypothetical protein
MLSIKNTKIHFEWVLAIFLPLLFIVLLIIPVDIGKLGFINILYFILRPVYELMRWISLPSEGLIGIIVGLSPMVILLGIIGYLGGLLLNKFLNHSVFSVVEKTSK